MNSSIDLNAKKTCFVVMGFGRKTDYCTGRVLDLDKSYRYIIKPAALAAGLDCRRADEIIHAGVIDIPMYEQLLAADVVIADVSTSNCNAFYELGVRHALRPYTTITIAEDKMVFPFDVNHVAIRRYQHMGDGIDYEEVERMRHELQRALEAIASRAVADSPVYSFLRDLSPPVRKVARAVAAAAALVTEAVNNADTRESLAATDSETTVSELMKDADDAMAAGNFLKAMGFLTTVRTIVPRDPYVVQKLAVATYKSEIPTPLRALESAKLLLAQLQPDVSVDPETLGLWGSVHKQIWERTRDRSALETAIFAYEKGFHLKNDHYNGINLAYMLDARASISEGDDAIADSVLARRSRLKVLPICETLLSSGRNLENAYWIHATMAEAWFGLGNTEEMQNSLSRAKTVSPPASQWMKDSTGKQLRTLAELLRRPLETTARAAGT
ncbi:MAG: TRAFs-binding domain-containing protein [Bryobacteraceae bacterium]